MHIIQCDHGAYKNYCYRRHGEKVVVVPRTIDKAIVNINCIRGRGGVKQGRQTKGLEQKVSVGYT